MATQQQQRTLKDRVLRLPCLMFMLLILWIVGGLTVITIFILGRSWKGTLFTALVLLAGMQLFFWYFRAKSLLRQRRQIRSGFSIHPRNSVGSHYPENDNPPTYEEILKADPPPPAYYEVISESFRFPFFSRSNPASPAPSLKSKAGSSATPNNSRKTESHLGKDPAKVHRSNPSSKSEEKRKGYLKDIAECQFSSFVEEYKQSGIPAITGDCICLCIQSKIHPPTPTAVGLSEQTSDRCYENLAYEPGSPADNIRPCNCSSRQKQNQRVTRNNNQSSDYAEVPENHEYSEETSSYSTAPVANRRQLEVAPCHTKTAETPTVSGTNDPVSTIRLPIIRQINCLPAQNP